MTNQKCIALIDCDSFFVSCERRLNPELKELPVSVVSGERGCVISRSKEAKMLGVPMGIPLFQAVERYPECIYITANHHAYTKISKQVMGILKNYSPNVEVYSIDEAFVDFTGLTKLYRKNYFKLAEDIQAKIMQETAIPVSIGVSSTKTLAKLASDKSKNTRRHICLAGKCARKELLLHTDIQEVWGIGRKLGVKLRGLGIRNALDYIEKDDEKLIKNCPYNKMDGYTGKITHDVKYYKLGNMKIGHFDLNIIKVSGHTDGSVLLIYKDIMFAGDTIFKGSIGRTDLYSGSESKMHQSLKLIKELNPNLIIYTGHGENTTLEEELKYNYYLR